MIGTENELSQEVEVKEWLRKVIDSCKHTVHFEYAKVLVDLYKSKVNSESDWVEMEDYRMRAYNDIHGIVVPIIN